MDTFLRRLNALKVACAAGMVLALAPSTALAHEKWVTEGELPPTDWSLVASGRTALTGSQPVLEGELPAGQGGWLAARCWVRADDGGRTVPDALTSAVSVHVADRFPPCPPEVLSDFRGHLGKMLDWIDAHGRFENPGQRERLRSIFEAAREVLAAR